MKLSHILALRDEPKLANVLFILYVKQQLHWSETWGMSSSLYNAPLFKTCLPHFLEPQKKTAFLFGRLGSVIKMKTDEREGVYVNKPGFHSEQTLWNSSTWRWVTAHFGFQCCVISAPPSISPEVPFITQEVSLLHHHTGTVTCISIISGNQKCANIVK